MSDVCKIRTKKISWGGGNTIFLGNQKWPLSSAHPGLSATIMVSMKLFHLENSLHNFQFAGSSRDASQLRWLFTYILSWREWMGELLSIGHRAKQSFTRAYVRLVGLSCSSCSAVSTRCSSLTFLVSEEIFLCLFYEDDYKDLSVILTGLSSFLYVI